MCWHLQVKIHCLASTGNAQLLAARVQEICLDSPLDQLRRLVAHRPIAALPLVPHSQESRVTGINEIDDPHVGLCRVLAVQATRILLQSALPRYRHRQYQGV